MFVAYGLLVFLTGAMSDQEDMGRPLHIKQLRDFLESSLSEDELRRLLADHGDPRLLHGLPTGASLVRVCDLVVDTLERQGLVNDELFDQLMQHLPAKRGQVEAIAAAWRQMTLPLAERRPTKTTRGPDAVYVYAIIELAGEARARRAVMLHEGCCVGDAGLLGLPRGGGSLTLEACESHVLLVAHETDVFVRLDRPHQLLDHDRLLLGDTLAEVSLGGHPAITLRDEQQALMVPLIGAVVLGRSAALDRLPRDPRMSRRHARIDALHVDFADEAGAARGPVFVLVDLGSSNGTWVKIRGRHRFGHGDMFRVYDASFRVEVTLSR